jgi:hypothetical protein
MSAIEPRGKQVRERALLARKIEQTEYELTQHEDEVLRLKGELRKLNERRLVLAYPDPAVRAAVVNSGDDE